MKCLHLHSVWHYPIFFTCDHGLIGMGQTNARLKYESAVNYTILEVDNQISHRF